MQDTLITQPAPTALRPEQHRKEAARSAVATAPSTKRLARVLLVEDDPALREALEIRLKERGCLVSSAGDGVSARWNLLTRRFDAVLLDLGLPNKNGLDVMLDVAQQAVLPPVLVLTGAGKDDQELARTLGATHVLQKPSPFWLVADALETLLEN